MLKRTRGYILTSKGAKKLQDAKREWESQHSAGCTEEKMRELTSPFKENGLDFGTIRKIFKGEKRVDKKSIRCLFSAFNLQLENDDLTCEPQACLPKLDRNFLGREEAIAKPNIPVIQADELDLDALVEKVRSHPHHRDKIQDQCGSLRILDVEWLVGIDNIYIDVNVLEKLPSNRRLELSDFHRFNPATDDFDRLGLGNVREGQVPGLEAVARYSKLMVLGKPGSGKTTFLKFLAIQCIRGEFQKERIPIFIELKVFAKDAKQKGEFSLLNCINQELYICDVSAHQVEKLLHQGRFLILLDGLDEVQANAGNEVMTEIEDFFRKYFRNQCVITCRSAAQLAEQRDSLHFTHVEVADFDEEQIEAFAKKWFVAVARNSREEGLTKATQFIEKLYLPENRQIRELAVTPILLNLTCLVFQDQADFPSKRSNLYEQGLDILLERWDKSRRIQREEVYRNLSLEEKQELLNQVAFITFNRGDYFFEQDQIQRYIADYLRTLSYVRSEPKALKRDSKAVLKSIEAQHGLLVERAREIYSFSHLTFQEYFTAKSIVDSSNWKKLVIHITKKQWREVFLLAVDLVNTADELLRMMKQQVDLLVASDEQLQQLLKWASQKSSTVINPYKAAAVRAYYLSFVRNPDRTLDFGPDGDNDIDFGFYTLEYIERVLEPALNFGPKLTNFASKVRFLCPDLGLDLALYCALEATFISVYSYCEHFLNHAFDITRDSRLRQALQQFKAQLPDWRYCNEEEYTKWMEDKGKDSFERLRAVITANRNIAHNWQFKNQQWEALWQYYNANELLVDCLNSSCNVSSEVRQEIEETLFLPKDELERRQGEGNIISSR